MFDYDMKLKEIVRSISGSAFSGTNRCFYIDDSEDNLRIVLKMLKDEADVDISQIVIRGEEELKKVEPEEIKPEEIKLEEIRQEEADPEYHDYRNYGPVEFRISEKEGLLVIKFLGRYDRGWIDEMMTYGRCYYDKNRREWMLQWSKLTCDSLADYFAGKRIKVNVKKQIVNNDLIAERKETGEEIRSKEIGKKALDGLDSMAMYLDDNRYSPRTRESYLSMLEFFFRYFSPKEPSEITEDEISRFIYDFIIRLGYSAAYQNQMVSAIKTLLFHFR